MKSDDLRERGAGADEWERHWSAYDEAARLNPASSGG